MSALAVVLEHFSDIPFIFVSGTLGEETAIDTLKRGATDYVLKHRLSRLAPAVKRALAEVGERTARRIMENQVLVSARQWTVSFDAMACLKGVKSLN
jgi:FixJ family two-component response regulator